MGTPQLLKHKTDCRLVGPGLQEVRATKGGKEIVKRVLVCVVGNREPKRRLETLPLEKIVSTQADVKHMAGCNARRVMVLVPGVGCGDHQPGRAVILWSALAVRKGCVDGRVEITAEEANGRLLCSRES